MFGFWKKKEVDLKSIKEFNGWIKAIKVFMVLSEWDKAKKALNEIRMKEKESLNDLMTKLDESNDQNWINQKEKTKLLKTNKKNKVILDKLKNSIDIKEEKYITKRENKRFKVRFKKIKDEINSLIWSKKNEQAMSLLQKFLEENSENSSVIKFFNKEKKKILKDKEKNKREVQAKIRVSAQLEAMNLIWKTTKLVDDKSEKKEEEDKEEKWLIKKLKKKLNFYQNIKERIRKKQLLDEINLLIDEDSKVKNDLAERKLANIHKWLIKELSSSKMLWYEIYWKILWADKISGDTFWLIENKSKYNFFLWDATWHWIRAWFIITLLSRLFNKYVKSKELWDLTFEINNWLKQDLKSRNFITWVFFEVYKENTSVINYVWMWHEPMYLFRKESKIAEKIIPWWLAAWIRLIKKNTDIKVKQLTLNDWDILLTYSDWIIENKNIDWEFYWMEKLEKAYNTICNSTDDVNKIYEYLINDIKIFKSIWRWCKYIISKKRREKRHSWRMIWIFRKSKKERMIK